MHWLSLARRSRPKTDASDEATKSKLVEQGAGVNGEEEEETIEDSSHLHGEISQLIITKMKVVGVVAQATPSSLVAKRTHFEQAKTHSTSWSAHRLALVVVGYRRRSFAALPPTSPVSRSWSSVAMLTAATVLLHSHCLLDKK